MSLAVTDGESSAVGSNAAAQETTEVGQETTEAGNQETTEVVDEETTEAEDGDETAGESASVTINDQESDGERIVIEEVTMEEGGFIAIHDETLLDGDALGSVVGTSVYLEAGTHENVIVTLGRPVAESQTLIAMPHQDTNENQVYDFVISGGEADGPYAATDGGAVVDEASVTVGEDEAQETTEEDEVEETTTEEVDDVETTEVDDVETTEEVDDVETTEEDDVETTEVDDVETTEEVDDVETTEVDDVETTEEDEVIETTTEAEDDVETTEVDDVETTEVDDVEEPADDEQQFIFKVEQMNIDRWSFVLGDEETPDRTETVSDITVQDRRVEINLTELLQQRSQMPSDQITTQDPEEAQEQLEENLSGDIETVRFVIENVNVENVTFVVTAPEDMELPETPGDMGEMTTEEDDDDSVETTTEEDEVIETTEEVDDVETTEEVDDVETTEVDDVETTEVDDVETTEEVDDVETTEVDDVETTEEVDDVETTEEVDDVETTEVVDDVETTTEDEEVVETTTEEVDDVETTEESDGEAADLESFDVSALNAPENAEVGDTITVSAVVENPNDAEATQDVAFRLEGTVVAREQVTLNGSASTTVEFEVDTTDVPPGEYVHGVYTRDFGDLAVITLDDPSAEETDGAAETETEVGDEETELPDDDEGTTVAVETTTAEA